MMEKSMCMLVVGLFFMSAVFVACAIEDRDRGSTPNTDSEPNGSFEDATPLDFGGGNTIQIIGNTQGLNPNEDPNSKTAKDKMNDFWKVDLTYNKGGQCDKIEVTTTTTGNGAIRIFIYDPNKMLLDGDPSPGKTHYVAAVAGMSGTFYIRYEGQVFGGENDYLNYQMVIKKTSVSDTSNGNNDPSTSEALTSFPITKTNMLNSPNDQSDFYEVNVTSTVGSSDVISMVLKAPNTGNFTLELYYPNKTVVPEFFNEPVDPSQIPAGLMEIKTYGVEVSGSFYIRIWAFAGSGQYTLTVNVVTVTKDGNDDPASASGVNFVDNHNAEMSDELGEGVDEADFYVLDTLKGEYINVSLKSIDYNSQYTIPEIYVELRDESNVKFGDATGLANPKSYASGFAPAGEYVYVYVYINKGAGRYNLSILTDKLPEANEWIVEIEMNESSEMTVNLMDYFTDGDNDPLTFTSRNNDANKIITTISDTNATFKPDPGWIGTENITITAEDPYGFKAKSHFHITVGKTSHPPKIVKSMPDITLQNGEIDTKSLNMNEYFTDEDVGDPVLNDHLTFHCNNTGEIQIVFSLIQGTPYHSGGVTIIAPKQWTGTQTVIFWATDDYGMMSGTLTCNITIIPKENKPPRWSQNFTKIEMVEGTTKIIELSDYATDPDPEDKGKLNFSAYGYDKNNVSVEISGSKAKISPAEDWYGKDTIIFNATDSKNASAEISVELIVVHIYRELKLISKKPISDVSINEGEEVTFSVEVEIDPEISDEDMSYRWFVNGKRVTAKGENYTFKTNYDSAAESPYTVEVIVNDSKSEVKATWKLTVHNVNRNPIGIKILSPTNGSSFTEGEKIEFRAGDATDPDDPTENLTYTWYDNDAKIGEGKVLKYSKLRKGTHKIKLTVTDSEGGSNSTVITIKIKPKEEQPGFEMIPLMMSIICALIIVRKRKT